MMLAMLHIYLLLNSPGDRKFQFLENFWIFERIPYHLIEGKFNQMVQ